MCHICIESPFHLPPTEGKFSKEEYPLDIFLPFKNLYLATASLLSVCLLFPPCLTRITDDEPDPDDIYARTVMSGPHSRGYQGDYVHQVIRPLCA